MPICVIFALINVNAPILSTTSTFLVICELVICSLHSGIQIIPIILRILDDNSLESYMALST
jgi:hypothetical protein